MSLSLSSCDRFSFHSSSSTDQLLLIVTSYNSI
ncbi:hypothetical protein DWV70_04505 [Phocaeicola vulgatus]|uniref:Uncharacterized protein n=1 Tax=Phocaeicola vulgatus TaxID=821 RepID=A0AAE8A0C4_PHOVU|nr:hypothetical protein DWV70_04505 [Phocaeicola vulgatus]RHK71849.1 hypothetical protein DW048_16970 [Phocaeicola vulgatus]